MISACSPIDRPVDGSAIGGALGTKCHGRKRKSFVSLAAAVLAALASRKSRETFGPNSRAGLDIDSAPPAIPVSIRPDAMES